jgi:5S rRNA maturation endonuclease (ribonuclease M5)
MSDTKLWWEDEAEIEKLASKGLSLDQVEAVIKEASRQNELKNVYADFDAAGRIMAHAYYDELMKIAQAKVTELDETIAKPETPDIEKQKLAALKELLHGNG